MEFRLLRADEIDCRVATVKKNGVSLLLYKDARCDMNILDETVGAARWQRKHEIIGGNLFCNVGVLCDTGEWVWKQDVGVESYTEKEKGQASDAFKRACFNWGLGRELYTAPFIWVNEDDVKIENKEGKFTTYDRFAVKEIGYTDRKISQLVIENTKTGKTVYQMGKKTVEKADPKWITAIDAECKRTGAKRDKVLSKMGINNPEELTLTTFNAIMQSFEKTPDGAYETGGNK